MRALEVLMELYPNKTAKEILEIQEQDKTKDQKDFEERNKKKLEFINDINTNGGYYRGKFGLDQYYYYRVFNLIMNNNGSVYMSVESIVLFYNNDGRKDTIVKPNEICLEKRLKEYCDLDQYSLEYEERITEIEWNYINNYLNNIHSLFW
jgi:hypothetical protein